MPGMGLTGYVAMSGRGAVACSGIGGRDTSHDYTMGFANGQAQYWTDAAAGNGSFVRGGMLPGTYTMRVFKGELAVHTTSVTVTAGGTNQLGSFTITGDPSAAKPLWRIGNWDGTPSEFLNGDKITFMHPSDVRLGTWNPGPYVVGSSAAATRMPCYQWKDVNGVKFPGNFHNHTDWDNETQPPNYNGGHNSFGLNVVDVRPNDCGTALPSMPVPWRAAKGGSAIRCEQFSFRLGSCQAWVASHSISAPISAPISARSRTGFLAQRCGSAAPAERRCGCGLRGRFQARPCYSERRLEPAPA